MALSRKASGRSPGKSSGRRTGAATRRPPSGRKHRSFAAETVGNRNEERPAGNNSPYIIAGAVGGLVVLIIILAIIARKQPEPGTTDNLSGSGVNEKQIYQEAVAHRNAGEKYFHAFTQTRNRSDGYRALAEIDKALEKLNFLSGLPTHAGDRGLEQEIVQLQQARIDIMRWLGL